MKSSIQKPFVESFFIFLSTLALFSLLDAARSGDKYETSSTNIGYSKFMKLKIRTVGPGDYGSYRCVAKNSLGETDGLIKLEGNFLVALEKCARKPIVCSFSLTFITLKNCQ